MDKNVIRQELERMEYTIVKEVRYKNYPWRFKLSNGVSVFCGDGNKLWFAGKHKNKVDEDLQRVYKQQRNTKVFVVYGHDEEAKNELIEMIHRWGLVALTIDNLPVQGRTIIEQLEHYIPETNYGIVLATPDDVGYRDNGSKEIRHRARQNVVLELGMLFSKLGRTRVTILLKKCTDFEKPSDIEGVLYKEYNTSVFEQETNIRKELIELGYDV